MSRRRNNRANNQDARRIWSETSIKRHKKRGMCVNIEAHELTELARRTDFCPVCGVHFHWDFKKWNKYEDDKLPTLDRKDNERILHIGNVMILCKRCNGLKGSLTLSEMADWAIMYLKFYVNRRK